MDCDMSDVNYFSGKSYPLTEKRCLKIGGHCYEMDDWILTTNPPIYSRTCKHCGHNQRGTSQPEIAWYDSDLSTRNLSVSS